MSARETKRYKCGQFEVAFFDEIVTADIIQYTYMAILRRESDEKPLMDFTSEVNAQFGRKLMEHLGIEQGGDAAASADGRSHFYCIFDQEGHHNCGASDDWGQAERFDQETLKTTAEGVGQTP